MTITAAYGTLSASEHSAQLRKAVIASTIGTSIEWYDFFLYGTAAGLRFVSADLGLFVFQYGLDLLDFRTWHVPGSLDLWAEAAVATTRA